MRPSAALTCNRFASCTLHPKVLSRSAPHEKPAIVASEFYRSNSSATFLKPQGSFDTSGGCMTRLHGLLCASAILLAASPVFAQSTARPGSVAPSTTTAIHRTHQEPCWKQAGLSQQVQQQRREVEQNSRAQIESVCNDSSLTQQQKHAKIRQIHEQSHQQIEALMSPQQRQAVESCRAQRGAAGGHGLRSHAGEGQGPCGSMAISGPAAKPFDDTSGDDH
jgi:TolA-binding protein